LQICPLTETQLSLSQADGKKAPHEQAKEMEMKISKREKIFEKRIKHRKLYSGNIFFASKNGFYEGKLKNYSRYGLFVLTGADLSIGEILIIALPYVNGKNIKCKGQIIWRNKEGIGIELFRKRSLASLRIIK
jgi:Tfp pilus assembly protein PilZ